MKKVTHNSATRTQIARDIRRQILHMSYHSKVGHLGSALSIVDIVVTLYFAVMRIYPKKPKHAGRDRFILSKGHAASALYAVLAKRRFFPKQWLETYCMRAGKLGTHPDHTHVPGVEWSTGSLGHGMSVGCGMALVLKQSGKKQRVFVLISDAESQEGEVWEAALTAAHHGLDNFIVIVDYNRVQAFGSIDEVLNLEPFADKWQSFGWYVHAVGGHDIKQLEYALTHTKPDKPTVVIAQTTRGKGISFMHNEIKWYYHHPEEHELREALEILE